MKPRYLTKSRFKLAMECPTKLFYTGKKEYVDNKLEDPFLEALAEGGFQVGELATAYYPGGTNIDTLDYDQALNETNELLKQDNCVIYEAAIKYDDFFIRVDILQKEGNQIKLIEVKAKSTDARTDAVFYKKDGGFLAGWKPYIHDIAFQSYVAQQAFPQYEITPYLMLVDKNAKSSTDGLNQKFKITQDHSGRKHVTLAEELTEEDLAGELLVAINMENACYKVRYEDTYTYVNEEVDFSELIKNFASMYKQDQIIEPIINSSCKTCEFKASDAALKDGMKSGYHECFKSSLQWEDKDFAEDNIFDLWDCRKTPTFIQEGKIKFADVSKEDIGFKEDNKPGLTRTERQWLQIEKSLNNDSKIYLDKENLKNEMKTWTYPLHFIDFETSSPAIPFNKGRRPYEGIAFQFSHHMVHEDGKIEHRSEYLNTEPGFNPNYEFVRRLKSELENDNGTIFKYSPHENTYLTMIYHQLQTDESFIKDKDELCHFIREITEYEVDKKKIEGPRNMVDLLKLVKSYYYDPYMKGSNSIKVVLPSILNSSDYLKEKYSKPIYGAKDSIRSLNFENETWIEFENGQVKDPYKLLPKLFDDVSDKDYEYLNLHEELNNGGAAMTAYERLQFEDIPHEVRSEIEKGMLKYCELDTLAMVMIYEAWADMIK